MDIVSNLYHPELWDRNLFGFICSLISIKFELLDNKSCGQYTYFTTDKIEFKSLDDACSHQLKLLLKENEEYEC